MVIVELIDFTTREIPGDGLKIVIDDKSSSDHENNNIQYLFNLLRGMICNNPYKQFSLQAKQIGVLYYASSENNYDIVVSEKHNILVVTHGTFLLIYKRIISTKPLIPETILFKVDFNIKLRCLKLNTENNQEYIYVSTTEHTILKINLTQLLRTKEQSIIWTSERFENLWGIDILNDRVYAMDYYQGIIVLYCDSGKHRISSSPKLPEIENSYHLVFISPKEMIISHDHCVELFRLSKKKWKSMKKTSFPIGHIFAMFYERNSSLIYLADSGGTAGEQIKVISGNDLSLVKSFGQFTMNYGMCIDRLSGLLYVCDAWEYIINVYQ